jgi:hypothetical protein
MTKTLIVHIGAGKTGTSSIQAALKENGKLLEQHRVKYLGMLLEYSHKEYPWQFPGGSVDFLRLPVGRQKREVLDILKKEIEGDDSTDTLVWSNEWMFGRHNTFIPALNAAKEFGYNVIIVCYVREHGSWSRSAYEQWGIKHKTYVGEIKTYREYFEANPIRFMASINPWIKAFDCNVKLRNFESRGDVVSDFFAELVINEEFRASRVNEKLSPEELLARAVFNNLSPSPTSPVEFLRCFRAQELHTPLGSESWMKRLLPTPDDIEWLRKATSADLGQLNQILKSSGEPPLVYREVRLSEYKNNQDVLNMLLLQLLTIQAKRISRLESELSIRKSKQA